MQRLILMRHAEAEAPVGGASDRDRILSRQGRADAVAMGRLLARATCRADLALVSPATRTQQTWDLVHDALGDVEVHAPEALYNGDADQLRRAIRDVEDRAGCLLVLAHNPGVHVLAMEYLQSGAAAPAALDRLGGAFPPGAAAVFAIDAAGRYALETYLQPPASPE